MENKRDSDAPQITLNWSQYVDTKGTGNRDVSSTINTFLITTIGAGHLKKAHHGRSLPRVLYGAKKVKAIKKTMDYFNENVFKTFWEAKREQAFLSTINLSRFHEHVEALEKDPDFENYNTFAKK